MFHVNRASVLLQDQHYRRTDQTELSVEPLHLEVPLAAQTMVSDPMVHQLQTVHLSCNETHTVSIQTKARFHMTIGSPYETHTSFRRSIGCFQIDFRAYGTFHANHAPTLHQDQHYLQTECPLEPLYLRVPSRASKIYLSCTKTNTISKEIEVRFYMIHVIQEFHRVPPNRFLSICYVPCNSCTYHASRLALSPNRAST